MFNVLCRFTVGGAIAAAAIALPAGARAQELELIGHLVLEPDQGEILDFSPVGGNTLVTTAGSGVRILDLDDPASIADRAFADFSAAFDGTSTTLRDTSSTAIDPLGRGFGVVALIPDDNGGTLGKIGFYDYTTGAVLGTIDAGYHPDSVKFSADGKTLYVANEGEFTSGGDTDAPGSVTVIDLSAVTGTGDTANATAQTFDFQAGNLGAGVTLGDLRINDPSATELYRHVEPEFMTLKNGKLYVTLQENNAIAEFDTATSKWTAIRPLGTITNTIDASDEDDPIVSGDPEFLVDDAVKGLPMPDALASFTINGKTYLVTANEGDFRVDDFDRARVKDFDAPGSNGDVDGIAVNDDDAALGRLRVSTLESDPDGDNVLEDIVMPGTRSFTVWNAETGALVKDSGGLETFLHTLFPLLHNAESGDPGEFDQRSDDKGPEPEGLDILQLLDGSVLVAVGMERQNGIVLARIFESAPDVLDIELLDVINNFDLGLISPESLLWVTGANSPTGRPMLLVGYEGVADGDPAIAGGIGVYSVVPTPTSAALGLAGLAAMAVRRRRRGD